MKATNIGKTIIVWNQLTDNQASDLIQTLKDIIINYRKLEQYNFFNRPIPIALEEKNNYLCIIKKHNEVFVCSTRNVNKDGGHSFSYNAIINGDFLYDSIYLLKNSYEKIQKQINILQKYPQHEWIKLPFSKSFENYCLSPNINPQNFIHHLENGTLSENSKDFLRQAGVALDQENNFSRELQNTIKDVNDLFIEER